MKAFDLSIYSSPAEGNTLRAKCHVTVEELADMWALDSGAKDKQPLLHFAQTRGEVGSATKSGANTIARTAVVLDLDRLDEGAQDCGDYDPTDECEAAGWECLIEESYSSGPGHRKWHIIIPLTEPVSSPDLFHATTMEAYSRLSAQPDRTSATFTQGVFQLPQGRGHVRHVLQGEALAPVKVELDAPRPRDLKRKRSPLTLRGAAGAWCRMFSAEDRIESGLYPYTPAHTQSQMKWKREGHASRHHLTLNHHPDGGELLYDWQEDSPTYGTVMSLWDFEREWLFGVHAPEIGRENLDDGVGPGTPPNRRPSQAAMEEYAMGIPGVADEIRSGEPTPSEVFARARVTARDVVDDDSIAARFGLSVERTESMLTTPISAKTGLRSRPSPQDLVVIAENDPEVGLYSRSGLDGSYGWAGTNSFVDAPDRAIDPQGYKVFQSRGLISRVDGHEVRLAGYLAETYHYESFSPAAARSVLDSRISRPLVIVNPIRDELERLYREYDPEAPSRLPELLYNVDRSEDPEFVLKMIRRWGIAMVRRATTDPGLKFHQILCFVGPQGAGKSSFFEWIAGDYLELLRSTSSDKDQLMGMHQAMVCLKDEGLDNFTPEAWDQFKEFVAAQRDRYRVPYDKSPEIRPRGFVFGATGNNPEFITRRDGDRRLWIVRVEKGHENEVEKVLTPELRDAVLGELMYLSRHSDEPLWLSEEEDRRFESVQKESFVEYGPLDEWLEEYLQSEHVEGYPFVDSALDTPGAGGSVPEYTNILTIQEHLVTHPVLGGSSVRDIRRSLRLLGSEPSKYPVIPPKGFTGARPKRVWSNPFYGSPAPSADQLFN